MSIQIAYIPIFLEKIMDGCTAMIIPKGQREIAVASVLQACHRRVNLHALHAFGTLLGE